MAYCIRKLLSGIFLGRKLTHQECGLLGAILCACKQGLHTLVGMALINVISLEDRIAYWLGLGIVIIEADLLLSPPFFLTWTNRSCSKVDDQEQLLGQLLDQSWYAHHQKSS